MAIVLAMPADAPTPPTSARPPAPSVEQSIRETLISLLISFVMALVFRSYVVEAFIIPTGSMAPTLLGAHMRFNSTQTGTSWAVNPWYMDASNEHPLPVQGAGVFGPPTATDPMTTSQVNRLAQGGRPAGAAGYTTPPQPTPVRAGDRILVQKYLYDLFPPRRYDVVVFKNPELSTQNFIKRLVGLPNEQIWLADGDVFARPIRRGEGGRVEPAGEWRVQRKPGRVQRSVWRTVFDSRFAPLDPVRDGRRWFVSPWSGPGWTTEDRHAYRCDTAAATALAWDSERWPVWDWVSYNEIPAKLANRFADPFPVADVRLSLSVEPDQVGLSVTGTIAARAHEFQAILKGNLVILQMRRAGGGAEPPGPWVILDTQRAPSPSPGRVTHLEFWHADQAMELWLDGRRVASGAYEWGPFERLRYATGLEESELRGGMSNPLVAPDQYAPARPEITWSFEGSALTVHRAALDRDLFYEPARFVTGVPALATHPDHVAQLGPDQFFVLGDNSPFSKDGRLWDTVDPWVADQIDATVGVVPRKLLLGKAFFVYFPAPSAALGAIPIPDFGRMRAIR